MRYYYRADDWWHIGFAYDSGLVSEVKKFNGAGYNPENKEWYVPAFIATDPMLLKWLKDNGFREGIVYTPSPRVLSYPEIPEIVNVQDVLEGCRALGLKRIPRHYQAEGIAYMLNHGNCINGDDCGLGKAQPLDTKILTPHGFIMMGDIKVGDEVLSPSGGVQTVIGVFPQGRKLTYKVTFSDGTSTRCCEEHLWNVATDGWVKRGKGFKTLTLREIMNEDVYTSSCQKSYRWRIPITNAIQYEKKDVLISPYLLGCLLGDGGVSKGVGFTTVDDEIIDKFSLPNGTMIYKRPSDDITYHIGNIDNILENKNSKSIMKALLREYRLLGTHSHNKFIPEDYLYNVPEIRLEVLRGLLDTDGYVSKGGHISFSSTSEQLKEGVKHLVLSLGGVCREKTRIGKYRRNGVLVECKRSWRLSIMLPPEIIPFKLKRKIDRLNSSRKYVPTRKIVEVRPVGFSEMQCIRVSNKDGLYLCDDFCVTHNTAQAICTCEILGCFPILVICPASVKYNWKKEWARWNPDRTVGVVDPKVMKRKRNTEPDPWGCDVTVINYDILSGQKNERGEIKPRYKELVKRMWGGCVIDEIHFLKNDKAIRSRMAKRVCRNIPNVWGLTGTLTQNRPADLIGPYTVLRRFVEIFGDSLSFKFRYCDAKKTVFGFDWGGASNLEELYELLRMAGYIRRNKRDVLEELPPLVNEYVDVPLTNEKEYRQAEEDLMKYLKDSGEDEKAQSAINAQFLVQLNVLRQLCIEGKMAFIKRYISEWLASNESESLVVFGIHQTPLQELANTFECPVIKGGVTPAKRQEIVERFSRREFRVLICNIQAAGTGLDGLQSVCSNMVFVEYPDRYTDIEQTVSRLERMGQTMPITVTYLMAPGTIDEDYRGMLESKRTITQTVNRGTSEIEFLKNKLKMKDGFYREVR